mgnify:FL=1
MIKNIVILTGAGISAESGIPVFRSETGLWENHRIEDVCVPSALERDPATVENFYNTMRRNLHNVEPNRAHFAVARLQKEWKKGSVTLVTQNIDNLHERAGSENLYHMHGSLTEIYCPRCGTVFPCDRDVAPREDCPHCGAKGTVRPHIVFFEEIPYHMEEIEEALWSADLFLAVGTSGVVYPAAGFARLAASRGAVNVEFNLSASEQAGYFRKSVYGKAGTTLPKFVDSLLKDGDSFIGLLPARS